MRSNTLYSFESEERIEATTLRNLEQTTEFRAALNTKVGKLLFDDLILLLDEKFKLIYEGNADERDKAIFSACKYIGNRWNELIIKHDKNVSKLEKIHEAKNMKKM